MNVKGLSIQNIMEMSWDEINQLSAKDLKSVTSRLVSASNKRIKRLASTETGKSSFAYQTVEERGRKFSVRGKDTNALRQEFALTKNFLNMKTSTVKGWKEYRGDVTERLTKGLDIDELSWSERTEKKFWKVYRRFEETHGGTYKKGDSDRIQQFITGIMENSDKRRSADYFTKRIEEEYSQMYESNVDINNIADAFDNGENE